MSRVAGFSIVTLSSVVAYLAPALGAKWTVNI